MTNLEYYEKWHFVGKIKAKRKNFLFLTDDTMCYDDHFNSYWEAMIDAIKNGENIDDLIALVFPEKFDHPIVKRKLIKAINETNS